MPKKTAKSKKGSRVTRAVVLAAGKGKRLDVFETPKPLLKVGGVPLIVHTLEQLRKAGIKDIYVVIKKGDAVIQKELLDYPANITFIEQVSSRRGMLDSLLSLENAVTGPFFVTVCDVIFSKNPYPTFLRSITSADSLAALIGTDEAHHAHSGATVRVLHDGKRIREIGSRLQTYNALDIGIYYVTNQALKELRRIDATEPNILTTPQIFRAYSKRRHIRPVAYAGREWFDINTPKTYIHADLFLGKNGNSASEERPRAPLKKLSTTTTLRHTKESITDIVVRRGILSRLDDYEVIPLESYKSPHHIIVDESVDTRIGIPVYKTLQTLGYRAYKHVLDSGEHAKSASGYLALSDKILAKGLDKKSFILGIGGGVTNDMAGFLASTLYRGIGFISIPTTILAQCDAAIALKQGVNSPDGKNLLGSYYAPTRIVVDPSVLETLDDRYISDGLAECIKQALAYDADFYELFKNYKGDIRNLNFLEKVIERSIVLKVNSIEQDMHEERVALVNQYGHEFGHAVEHLSGYAYRHGESVAVGMRVSAELAHVLGITSKEVVDAHIALLKKYKLPFQVPKKISPEDILDSLRYNKKYYSGEPRFVLVKDIGTIWRDRSQYTVSCRDEFIIEAVQRSYA